MVAWPAISRVFHFRVPLSGDRGHCPVMRRRPGPLAFSLRTLHQRRAARQAWSSRSHRNISARWFWRGCVCHCKKWMLSASGRHRAACPRSGRLRSRAVGPERILARVCREAGATVLCNVRLRVMSVAVCNRHAFDRGAGDWVAAPSRCPTCCGHHIAVCSHICLPCRNGSTLNLSTGTVEAVGVMKL